MNRRDARNVNLKKHSTNLTVRQTAEVLNLSEACVRAWVAARRISYVRLGRSIRVPQQEIDRLMSEGAVPAVAVGR